jgi:hypothetical protein
MSTDYTPPTFTRHVKTKPPDTLYHYTGQLGLLGITQTAELWATKIQYMNDATEFHRALSMACNQLDVMVSDLSNDLARKAACQKLRGSLSGLGDINIFVACFCEHGDLLSQWRGYSENSAGCSIGFDAQQLDESASRDGFILGRCIYDGAVQREIITEMITHIVEEEVAGRANWGFHGPLAEVLFRCGAFFKDLSFDQEKEWRMVSPTTDFRHDRLCFRTGRSMITPFYKLPIRHDGRLPIRHVIVGPCPHMELSKSAVTALLMQAGLYGPLQGQQIVVGSKIPFRNW